MNNYHSILADIPASLAMPLSERDDFRYMRAYPSIVSLGHGGDRTSEGANLRYADMWHTVGCSGEGAGDVWSAKDPTTYDKLIVFDPVTNDTTNRFGVKAGERVSVLLQWNDTDNSNTDLNLLVSSGTAHYTSSTNQLTSIAPALPVEWVGFIPSNDDLYDISIAVIGTTVPDRIQLLVAGIASSLEHRVGEGAASHGRVGSNNEQIDLVVTSHNPVCTALVLESLGAARFTDIYPSYGADDMVNGINVTAAVWARDANAAISALVGQPEVSSVAAYSLAPYNATSGQPALLEMATDPDADNSGAIRPCSDNVGHRLATYALGRIGWAGAEPGTEPRTIPDADPARVSDPGSEPTTLTLDPRPVSRYKDMLEVSSDGSMVEVYIWTYDIMITWAFLQENGGLVTSVPRDYENWSPDTAAPMSAYVQPHLIGSLMLRSEVLAINAAYHEFLGP